MLTVQQTTISMCSKLRHNDDYFFVLLERLCASVSKGIDSIVLNKEQPVVHRSPSDIACAGTPKNSIVIILLFDSLYHIGLSSSSPRHSTATARES